MPSLPRKPCDGPRQKRGEPLTAEPRLLLPEPPEGWSAWLRTILDRLYGAFGPRYWWPSVKAPTPVLAEPFEMIAGAILVQNVAWSNTERALMALEQEGLLTPAALLEAPDDQVEGLIRPAGYYRQKSLKLKRFAAHLRQHYHGDLAAMLAQPLPDLRQELLALNGIGPETADCILCYAAGKPIMPMDTYTRRIFARIGLFPAMIRYEEMQAFFHRYTAEDAAVRGEYHAQIDTLGHRICLKSRPACEQCPLHSMCQRVGVVKQAETGRRPAPWAQEAGG